MTRLLCWLFGHRWLEIDVKDQHFVVSYGWRMRAGVATRYLCRRCGTEVWK